MSIEGFLTHILAGIGGLDPEDGVEIGRELDMDRFFEVEAIHA